jgi:hypothetical protein
MSDIVAEYNSLAKARGVKAIKKFRTLAVGNSRLKSLKEKPVTKSAVTKSTVKKTRSSLNPDATIVIVDEINTSKGETRRRWDALISAKTKTVGHFVEHIGKAGDIKWWIDRGKIKLKE